MNHPERYAAERLAYRLLFSVLIALFLAYIVPLVWDTLSPFIIALPVAAMLQPLIRFFQRRLRVPRGFAVTFWVVLFSAALTLTGGYSTGFLIGGGLALIVGGLGLRQRLRASIAP